MFFKTLLSKQHAFNFLALFICLVVIGSFTAIGIKTYAEGEAFPLGTSKAWTAQQEKGLTERFKQQDLANELMQGSIDYCFESSYKKWLEAATNELNVLQMMIQDKYYPWWKPNYFDTNTSSPTGTSQRYYPETKAYKKLKNKIVAAKQSWKAKQPCRKDKSKPVNDELKALLKETGDPITRLAGHTAPLRNFDKELLRKYTKECNKLKFSAKAREYNVLIQQLREGMELFKYLTPDGADSGTTGSMVEFYGLYKKVLKEHEDKLSELTKEFNKKCGKLKDSSTPWNKNKTKDNPNDFFRPKDQPKTKSKNMSAPLENQEGFWEQVSKTTIKDKDSGEPLDGNIVVIPKDPMFLPSQPKDLISSIPEDNPDIPLEGDDIHSPPTDESAGVVPDNSKPWVNEKVDLRDWAMLNLAGKSKAAEDNVSEISNNDGLIAGAQSNLSLKTAHYKLSDQIHKMFLGFVQDFNTYPDAAKFELSENGLPVFNVNNDDDKELQQHIKELLNQHYLIELQKTLYNSGLQFFWDIYRVSDEELKRFSEFNLTRIQLRSYKAIADQDGDGIVSDDDVKGAILLDHGNQAANYVATIFLMDAQRSGSPLYLIATNFLSGVFNQAWTSGQFTGMAMPIKNTPATLDGFNYPPSDAPTPNDIKMPKNEEVFNDIDLEGDGNNTFNISNDDEQEVPKNGKNDPKRGPTVIKKGDDIKTTKPAGKPDGKLGGKPAKTGTKPPVVKPDDTVVTKATCHAKHEGIASETQKTVWVKAKSETFIARIYIDPKTGAESGYPDIRKLIAKKGLEFDMQNFDHKCISIKVIAYDTIKISTRLYNDKVARSIGTEEFSWRDFKVIRQTSRYTTIQVPALVKIKVKCLKKKVGVPAKCPVEKKDCDCCKGETLPLKGGTKTTTDGSKSASPGPKNTTGTDSTKTNTSKPDVKTDGTKTDGSKPSSTAPKTGETGKKPATKPAQKAPCNKWVKFKSIVDLDPKKGLVRTPIFQELAKHIRRSGYDYKVSECQFVSTKAIVYDTAVLNKQDIGQLLMRRVPYKVGEYLGGGNYQVKYARLYKATFKCYRKCPPEPKKELKMGMDFDPIDSESSANASQNVGFVEPACDRHGQADLSSVNDTHFNKKSSWKQPYDDQWALKRIGFKSPSDWPKEPKHKVVVAVIDTGLDFTHPDLLGALWTNKNEVANNGIDDDGNGFVDDVHGWNFVDGNNDIRDNNGHGTLVAGIIGARTNNGKGIAGVNPWAKIMPVKVTDFDNAGTNITVTEGIIYAVDNGADVINISIGGNSLSRAEHLAVEYAMDRDVLVVVASGNDGVSTDNYSPAGIPQVITVASTDLDNKRVNFSNWGSAVDLAAPGVDILSLRARYTDFLVYEKTEYTPQVAYVGNKSQYYRTAGSSFSAPFVAGVASLIRAQQPRLFSEDVARMLTYSAMDIEEPGKDQYTGYGLLDAKAALTADPKFHIEARIDGVKGVRTDEGVVLQVEGLADADAFKSAWFEIAPVNTDGSKHYDWTKVGKNLSKPIEGTLITLPFSAFADAPEWLIRLVVTHENGRQWENRYKVKLR